MVVAAAAAAAKNSWHVCGTVTYSNVLLECWTIKSWGDVGGANVMCERWGASRTHSLGRIPHGVEIIVEIREFIVV